MLTSTTPRKHPVSYAPHNAIKLDMIRQLTCLLGSECIDKEFSKIGGARGRVQAVLKINADGAILLWIILEEEGI
jgi:hypothetical protein